MTYNKTPILFIDIEGGWGGSSRSLYYIVKNLDKNRFTPVVVYGKEGPIKKKYSEIGVPAHLFTPLPRIQALDRNNHKSFAVFALKQFHVPRFLLFVKGLFNEYKFKLVHLNHESLFFIAMLLRLFFRCKVIYHVRTMLPKNIFGRIQVNMAKRTADYIIFISENEQRLWQDIQPKINEIPQSVVYNIFESPAEGPSAKLLADHKNKFKLAVLSTISRRRGTDRLVEVALSLKRRNLENVLFAVCGNGEPSYVGLLKKEIRDKGLDGFFTFLGHQDPESILAECDTLIKLHRTNNPWGRNVIEAMMCGRPVISLGAYRKFVEDGINGYLFPEFDAEKVAEKIAFLSVNPEVVEKMGEAGRHKGKEFFGAQANISKIDRVYSETAVDQSNER